MPEAQTTANVIITANPIWVQDINELAGKDPTDSLLCNA